MAGRIDCRKQPTKKTKMKRYQLFREFSDAILWGSNLVDALRRVGQLQPLPVIVNNKQVRQEPIKISKVLGLRDTAGSTRGQWSYISAVVELDGGRIVEVDAREVGSLVA